MRRKRTRRGVVLAVESVESRQLLSTMAPAILDDSSATGFSETSPADWTQYSGGGHDNNHSAALGSGGVATTAASWTFHDLTPGVYVVDATWVQAANRATNAPFSVFNGSTLLGTTAIDQTKAPGDFVEDGVGWKSLGEAFDVTGDTLAVQLTNATASGSYVVADGVRIQRVGDLPQAPKYLDDSNSGAGFSETSPASWTQYTGGGLDNNHSAALGSGGAATATASWTFNNLAPGVYVVDATWVQAANRATNAPFSVYDGSTLLASPSIDQTKAPGDFFEGGVGWKALGEAFNITSNTVVVQLSNATASGSYVVADGVRIRRVADLPATNAPSSFLDDNNSGAGFNETAPASWTQYSGAGLFNTHSAAPGSGGAATTVASWTFDDLTPGVYAVDATWVQAANRATNAPFSVYDGSNLLASASIDQTQAPGDFVQNGVGWKALGEAFAITGDTLSVQLSNAVNGGSYVVADGVRIRRIGDLPAASSSASFLDDSNSGAGFSETAPASWTQYTGGGLDNNHSAALGSGGAATATASWTFNDLTPGVYVVDATWVQAANRATNAPFSVSDGSTLLTSASIDQTQVPGDFFEDGVGWKALGQAFDVTGSSLVVQLSNAVASGSYVVADGVRIRRIGDLS